MSLPVGIPTESIFLIVLLRTIAVVWEDPGYREKDS